MRISYYHRGLRCRKILAHRIYLHRDINLNIRVLRRAEEMIIIGALIFFSRVKNRHVAWVKILLGSYRFSILVFYSRVSLRLRSDDLIESYCLCRPRSLQLHDLILFELQQNRNEDQFEIYVDKWYQKGDSMLNYI